MNREVESYLLELEARHVSKSLRRSSGQVLDRLILYLREAHFINDWREVNDSHLRAFAVFAAVRHRTPQGKHITPGTLRLWLSRLHRFFEWMHRRGYLLYDPSEQLILPKRERALPFVLNESEIARLIEMPDVEKTIGLRDRAIMEVLYATGIRHAEAHKLDIYDVDTLARRLTVRQGKDRRDRIVPLTETAAYWLSRYIAESRIELANGKPQGRGWVAKKPFAPSHALWLSTKGRRLSYLMVWQLVNRYAKQAELKANVHTFRHSCATHLLRGGADIRYIQQLLGHTDLETTVIYTHVETSDLKRAVDRAAENL